MVSNFFCIGGGGGKVWKRSRFPAKFWHRKTFNGKRGDLSHFSVEKFSSHIAEKLFRGPLDFRNVLVSNFFGIMGIIRFCRIFSVSQFRKTSWEELFNVSERYRHGNILCRRRRYHYFPLQLFFLTVPKSLVRGIIQRFRNNRVSKNFMHMKGLSLFSVETSFFSQCRKISWEELINVSEILVHGKYL